MSSEHRSALSPQPVAHVWPAASERNVYVPRTFARYVFKVRRSRGGLCPRNYCFWVGASQYGTFSVRRSFLGTSFSVLWSVWTPWITDVLSNSSTSEPSFIISAIFSGEASLLFFLNSSFIFTLAASNALLSFLKTCCLVLCSVLKSCKTYTAAFPSSELLKDKVR